MVANVAHPTIAESIATVSAALDAIKGEGAQKIRDRIALVDIRSAVEREAASIGEQHNVDEPLALLAIVVAWRLLVNATAVEDMRTATVDLARKTLTAISHGITEIKDDEVATEAINNLIKAYSAGELVTPADELILQVATMLAQNKSK